MAESANPRKKVAYTAVEGFCGPGGMSIGIQRAGFLVLYAFDADEMAVKTYDKNVGKHVERRKAEDLTGDYILRRIGLRKGELGLFSGGPPCQGFSKQKRGAHKGDPRNKLVPEFARLIRETMPRAFMLENVAMLGKKRGKRFIREVLELLEKDYRISAHYYNSADYGLAQTRERYVVVGLRKDVKGEFRVPKPTVRKWRTVGQVIGHLPEPPSDYTEHPDYPNHQRARVTPPNIKRFSFVPQGGGWQDIPEEYRLKCHKKADVKSGGWPDVYGRLRWDEQCPTITGGFDSFTRGRYGHPLQDRPLTPHEAALLQGFPPTTRFFGTRGDIRSQIGNAVPPPLAEAVATQILRLLRVADGVEKPPAEYESDAVPRQLTLEFL